MAASSQSTPRQRRLPSQVRRQEFISKAIEIFSQDGFESSTRELARRLGVTQPLLYRYFPSKDDLIREVYQTVYLNRWKPHWDALLCDRARPLRGRLTAFYDAYTDAIFTREWLRIYLFCGLKGAAINRWYIDLVEERILARIITEHRYEAGNERADPITPREMERAWILQGAVFYYGIRKHIYETPVLEDKATMIADAVDVFLNGAATLNDCRAPDNRSP